MPINNITQTISELPEAGRRGIDVQTQFVIKQEDFQDHLQGTTVTELNTLKDQLNTRIGEINSTATTMGGYADTASASASTATTKAGEASTSASGALTSRNQAETFKNNASASATKASQWADNNYNAEVETGKYSAKHWATVAQAESSAIVKLTGNQTVDGTKTFTSSPVVPTPTTDFQVTTKKYVDDNIPPEYNPTPIIATGTATFTATTNNINLTGIGVGVEIGDVIQISGAEDAKNNSEFTVEVITDANNIIVNQAHANKGTSKNVATRASDTGVTVKLLSKWYNADDKLGRDWVDVSASRIFGVSYPNNTNRAFGISGWFALDNSVYVVANLTIGSTITQQVEIVNGENIPFYSSVSKGENYSFSKSGSGNLNMYVREYR